MKYYLVTALSVYTPIKHIYKVINAIIQTYTRAHSCAESDEMRKQQLTWSKWLCVCGASEQERKIQGERSSSWLITATKPKESAVVEVQPARVQKSRLSPLLLCDRPYFGGMNISFTLFFHFLLVHSRWPVLHLQQLKYRFYSNINPFMLECLCSKLSNTF